MAGLYLLALALFELINDPWLHLTISKQSVKPVNDPEAPSNKCSPGFKLAAIWFGLRFHLWRKIYEYVATKNDVKLTKQRIAFH